MTIRRYVEELGLGGFIGPAINHSTDFIFSRPLQRLSEIFVSPERLPRPGGRVRLILASGKHIAKYFDDDIADFFPVRPPVSVER